MKSRYQRCYSRVIFILKLILKALDVANIPRPIATFFDQFFSHRSVVWYDYLTEFETNRLYIDEETNTYYNMEPNRRKFLISSFIISKVLITKILTGEKSLGIKLSPFARTNLKILASVIYQIYITFAVKLCPAKEFVHDAEFVENEK